MSAAVAGARPIPGPKGLPVLGSLPEFRKDIVQTLMDGWRGYGDVVRFRGPLSVYSIAHPDHVQYILRDNAANYRHPDFEINKLKPTFRNGLVTSQGEFWRRQRDMVQPAFHRDLIEGFAGVMADTTAATIERWRTSMDGDRTLDMRVAMQRLTLNILTKAVFTTDWATEAEQIMEAVTVANEHTNKRLLAPIDLPEWMPLPAIRRFVSTRQAVDDMVYGLIAERRRSGEDKGDLLSLLMGARDANTGEGMTDLELHDELISMIFAGHETVSVCLTWTWYLLAKDRGSALRLEEEVDEVLGGRAPTLADTKRLPFTWRVLQEALRLYPPIWLVPRTALEDDEIDGYRLPAGQMLFLCPYVTHRHTDFWDNPEAFDPDRLLPEKTSSWHRFQYFPFGGGPRKCLGHEFAMLEMLIIVAMVAQQYRLHLVPGHPVAPQPMVTLRPKHGMPMLLEPRAAG
jgi:cytochrome P450